MPSPQPFSPSPSGTVTLAVTSVTGNIALPTAVGDGPVAVTSAVGSTICFISFGSSSITATAPNGTSGSYPILPGTTQVLDRGNATNVAAITASSTATLYFTTGQGV